VAWWFMVAITAVGVIPTLFVKGRR